MLDVSAQTNAADYFVLVNGLSRPQIKALAQEIQMRLKAAGVRRGRAEGYELSWWVLLDFGDVVVHVMQPEAREYYDLDGLYGDSREIAWREVALPELPLPRHAQVAE